LTLRFVTPLALYRRQSPDEKEQVKDYWRPTQLQSPVYVIFEATSQLPPRPITDFLVGLFFKYVQLNCFYIGEGWIKEKLDICYNQVTDFAASDVSWVCAIFIVLAIGTQVAHMEADRAEVTSDTPEDLNLCSEDAVGVVFYHVACKLIPDVLTIASHESVQPFYFLRLIRYHFPPAGWPIPTWVSQLRWRS
jgi:hypothetical protein